MYNPINAPDCMQVIALDDDYTFMMQAIRYRTGHILMTVAGKTVTMPAPTIDEAMTFPRTQCLITNNSNGAITVACTNGFAQGGDSLTVGVGVTVWLIATQDGLGGYIWAVLYDSGAAAQLTAAELAGIQGAATAVTALNPVVTAADTLTADELAAVEGAAAPDGTNVFATMADIPAIGSPADWTWVPEWDTATPAGMTITAKRTIIGKLVQWWLHIITSDPGNGGGKLTAFAFPADMQPADLGTDVKFPIYGFHIKDAGAADTWTTLQGKIDVAAAAGADRKVSIKNDAVWADNEVTELFISGSHYIA